MKPFIYAAILMGLVVIQSVSCKYEDVLPLEPDPGIQISFSEEIIPIFGLAPIRLDKLKKSI